MLAPSPIDLLGTGSNPLDVCFYMVISTVLIAKAGKQKYTKIVRKKSIEIVPSDFPSLNKDDNQL